MYRKHAIRSLVVQLDPRAVLPGLGTSWSQLILAEQGHAELWSDQAVWLVVPGRAVWLPAGRPFELRARTQLGLRCVYFPANDLPDLADQPQILQTDPLLRALLLEAVADNNPPLTDPDFQLVLQLMHRRLATAPTDRLALPLPTDPRARALAEAILGDVGASLELQAARVGASLRTVQRLFVRQTGASLGAWRRDARLHTAQRLLISGQAVHQVAEQVGYSSSSAFIAAFRRRLGQSPSRWRSKTNRGSSQAMETGADVEEHPHP